MKLYWSSRSPFVRKVMVAAHETGVAHRIETVPVRVFSTATHDELMQFNPIGKIPTLIRDDGSVLYDSVVICAYLDSISVGARIIPQDIEARLTAQRREALADGLMETLLNWLGERIRQQPEHSDKRIAVSRVKVAKTLAAFEADVAALESAPLDIGHIAIGSALAYMDFRFAAEEWRAAHPELTRWHADFSARPSAVATAFVDDLKLNI